jgi:hypothetical protein
VLDVDKTRCEGKAVLTSFLASAENPKRQTEGERASGPRTWLFSKEVNAILLDKQ